MTPGLYTGKEMSEFTDTGSVDHACRLFKSGLISTPLCPFCSLHNEAAHHIFWECVRWDHIRRSFLILYLFTLQGSLWPSCYSECGWIDTECGYGLELLDP